MNPDIEVRTVSDHKGRGVFARKDFQKGDVIEACPVILLSVRERKHCEHTILSHYLYPWKSTRTGALVLGYGSIYNHSFHPNADWIQDFQTEQMIYKAVMPIKKGEEITVNYNGETDDIKPIDWFDVKD